MFENNLSQYLIIQFFDPAALAAYGDVELEGPAESRPFVPTAAYPTGKLLSLTKSPGPN